MNSARLWQHGISHRGENDVREFCKYFKEIKQGKLGLIAAAGFDPRSCVIAELVAENATASAVFIREERPTPTSELLARAEAHVEQLAHLFPKHVVMHIEVLDQNNGVVGGRKMVAALERLRAESMFDWTDVIIDASALTIGISFPLIRYFLELAKTNQGPRNVHVFMASNAMLDEGIVPIASDRMAYVHAFVGAAGLQGGTKAAKLWLPQLARGEGRKAILETIYRALAPDETLPILPFPASNPRFAEELIDYYVEEFESVWEVGSGDIVYADESDPLDVYRTILRLHDSNEKVYAQTGGSIMVLSPIGSKALALGAMMAAYERNLAVAYVEAVGFDARVLPPTGTPNALGDLVHIWLAGDVYL